MIFCQGRGPPPMYHTPIKQGQVANQCTSDCHHFPLVPDCSIVAHARARAHKRIVRDDSSALSAASSIITDPQYFAGCNCSVRTVDHWFSLSLDYRLEIGKQRVKLLTVQSNPLLVKHTCTLGSCEHGELLIRF